MYLSFDHVTKYYGATAAVQNVSFTVDQGQFVSLLGPSGCGKTTSLLMLAGFTEPSAGRVYLDGQDITASPPEKRGVGVVFQHYALFPHMTVAENIAFGLTYGADAKLSRAAVSQRVCDLLDMIDLTPLAQRKPAELSAGQQQRVAIARSLAPRPRVLCLDEPLSALDALLREKLRLEIRRIQRELGLTVLYVTHDQEEALAISDKVVVMSDGHVMQIGTPWEIYDQPANQFVAGFIGKGALLTGELVAVDSNIKIALAGGRRISVPRSTWCGSLDPVARQGVSLMLRAERAEISLAAANTANTSHAGAAEASAASSEAGAQADTRLAFSGRLVEAEFLGGWLRLHVETSSGPMPVMVQAATSAWWRECLEKPVVVWFRPEDARVMPLQS